MKFTTKYLDKRIIYNLGRIGIRLSKWGSWEGLESASQAPRYRNIENWRLEYKPTGSVLDVGCGSGILLNTIHKSDSPKVRYCGIDCSKEAIQLARSKIIDRELESFLRRDIRRVPASSHGLFDFIVFNEVLYYLRDPVAIIAEYKNLLEESGVFVVSIYKNFRPDPRNHCDETWEKVRTAYEKHCIECIFVDGEENRVWRQALYSKNEAAHDQGRWKVHSPQGNGATIPS